MLIKNTINALDLIGFWFIISEIQGRPSDDGSSGRAMSIRWGLKLANIPLSTSENGFDKSEQLF